MKSKVAIFAAGCFWGTQDYFDQIPGVLETEVGYIGGQLDHPTYQQVLSHTTGHAEAVRIIYDPAKLTYAKLLEHFFRMHDPTQLNRQGPDVGDNYRSAIFYLNDKQQAAAAQAIKRLNSSKRFDQPVVTSLEKAPKWWPAEDYHQKYTQRTGIGACHVSYSPL